MSNGKETTDAPSSPFFQPSNPRLSDMTSSHGTHHDIVVVKKRVGGEEVDVPVTDVERKSSLLGAYANLCNIIIGGGIVGLPYAIKESGLVLGAVMILVCAFMTDRSLRQIINTGKLVNVNSYETLMEAAFGRPGFLFVTLNMLFMSYGTMVAYLSIIKDILPILLHVSPHDEIMKRFILFASSLIIILPLSMQRDMADLEKTSRFNVLLNVSLVLLVVWFSPIKESVEAQKGFVKFLLADKFFDPRTFFVGFGICSFAFVCQDSSFIIAGSLSNPTKSRWKTASRAAVLTCCILELTMGLCGYLAYQSNTAGNVLNNMNIHHWSGFASRAILGTTMFLAYPMNLYVARHACLVLFFKGITAHEGDDHHALKRRDRRIYLTLTLYTASLMPALAMKESGLVLAATGAIGASSLAYIGPGLSFLAVYNFEFITLIQSRWSASSKFLCYFPSSFDGGNNDTSIAQDPVRQKQLASTSSKILILTDTISWYLLLMPIWSSIAQTGQKQLSDYFEKEELMSPRIVRPRRLNAVDFTGCVSERNYLLSTTHTDRVKSYKINRSSSDDVTGGGTYGDDVSYGKQHNQPVYIFPSNESPKSFNLKNIHGGMMPLLDKVGINETQILFKNTENHPSSKDIEMELKRDNPAWSDFLSAITFIIIGVVAMILGIVSILMKFFSVK